MKMTVTMTSRQCGKRAARKLARSMTPSEVDALMASDLPQTIPSVARERIDVSLALVSTQQASADLACLKFAGATVVGQLDAWARVRENLRAALEIADREYALALAAEGIRMPRSA